MISVFLLNNHSKILRKRDVAQVDARKKLSNIGLCFSAMLYIILG